MDFQSSQNSGPIGLYRLVRPLLFSLPAESAHNLALAIARSVQALPPLIALQRSLSASPDPALRVDCLGLSFASPLGIAAGMDKNAVMVDYLLALGFGFVEVGSVTNEPRPGNPRPRMFRLEKDNALINRMGLNNHGPKQIRKNIESLRHALPHQIAVNVAKTHDPEIIGERGIEDICSTYRQMAALGSFTVINVSCPNTKEGKTFESKQALEPLLRRLSDTRNDEAFAQPLLIKFSPDLELDTLRELIDVCESFNIDGYVIGNTSSKREGLKTSEPELTRIGAGGLSGAPVFKKAHRRVAVASAHLKGSKPIIAVGGVCSAESAFAMYLAGASLVELYSSLVYRGPGLPSEILRGLSRLLRERSCNSLQELIGSEATNV